MDTIGLKRAIIACDYHQTTQKVAEVGYNLAKSMGAEIFLLHITDQHSYYTLTEPSPDPGFAKCMKLDLLQLDDVTGRIKESERYLDNIKEFLQDLTIQTYVMDGDTAETILQAADDFQADLIVIGSHSRKWKESITMGNIAERVFLHSSVPVLIVPTKKY